MRSTYLGILLGAGLGLGPAASWSQEAAPDTPPVEVAPDADVPTEAVPAAGTGDGARASTAGTLIDEIKKSEELALSGRGGYNYDPAGRRDPFVNPLRAREESAGSEVRPEGWPGMLINEVRLQGITVYGDEPIAVFIGTDDVGYFKHEGDELWDGKIDRIDFDEQLVIFEQKVEDPSSPIRFRKVERKLHP